MMAAGVFTGPLLALLETTIEGRKQPCTSRVAEDDGFTAAA
jgi:hypothetical protein